MSLVLSCAPSHPLVCKQEHRISMEIDFPVWVQNMERINFIRSSVSKNMNDMYANAGVHLPSLWYMHIDEFPLMWSLDPVTLRVRISAIVYGMY